jgi:serine/threonine protein kinase
MKLEYAFQTKTHLFYIMEYCPGGELFYDLRRLGSFKERTVKFFAASILLALEYMHN